jgi:hypothetical protein
VKDLPACILGNAPDFPKESQVLNYIDQREVLKERKLPEGDYQDIIPGFLAEGVVGLESIGDLNRPVPKELPELQYGAQVSVL